MAIYLPRPLRPLFRLWYCRIRRVHDFTAFGVGVPYAWRVCSLCPERREGSGMDLAQIRSPRTGRYVLVDRAKGRILEHREVSGPYPDVPVVGI